MRMIWFKFFSIILIVLFGFIWAFGGLPETEKIIFGNATFVFCGVMLILFAFDEGPES